MYTDEMKEKMGGGRSLGMGGMVITEEGGREKGKSRIHVIW